MTALKYIQSTGVMVIKSVANTLILGKLLSVITMCMKMLIIKYLEKAFSQNQNPKSVVSFRSRIRVFATGFSKRMSGSLTVEAALVMPVFLFFMVSILYIFQIINTQAETYLELHQRGNRICFEGYVNREQLDDGIVELTETYRIKPLLFWQDFGQLRAVQKYYGYAWIGYDVSRGRDTEDTKEYVFVTETGTVYHVTMGCSHLSLSVKSVEYSSIPLLRNDSGGKYYQCERCPKDNNGTVLITAFGTRYHSDLNCSGLKRTVSTLELKEAISQGYRGCSRCSS